MKNHIEAFTQKADKAAADYYSGITEEALEKAATSRLIPGSMFSLAPEAIEQYKKEAKTALTNTTISTIKAAQDSLQKQAEEESSRVERKQLIASSGLAIAERYAKANGISQETALQELNHYASIKTSNYGSGLTDRYAALHNRNRDGISLNDSRLASQYEQEEYKAAGIAETLEALNQAKYLTSQPPQEYLRLYNTSGAALLRSLKAKP